jgi:hypothetical protein
MPFSSAKTKPLPDLSEVAPIGENDEACMAEVRRVLEKYGCLERFGLALLHQHFALNENEALVETCNADTRTITTRPMPQEELSGVKLTPTSWRLDQAKPVMMCFCADRGQGHNHWPSRVEPITAVAGDSK